MLITTAPVSAVIESTTQTITHRITVDLPVDGFDTLEATALHIEAQTTTDMPADTRLSTGYPAMSATFTLAGMVDPSDASKTAAWLFGKYSTDSPLYRQQVLRSPVTIDVGIYATDGLTWLRKFTGYVDEVAVGTNGAVAFTCIDRRTLLRSSVDLPAVVTAPPFNAGLTSEFAVDALLRNATGGAVSSWPATRPQCVLSVGMRSSVWPEVGTLTDAFAGDGGYTGFAFAPGKWGTALAGELGNPANNLMVDYMLDTPIAAGQATTVEFVASPGANAYVQVSDVGGMQWAAASLYVSYTDGIVGVGVQGATKADSYTVPVSPDPANLPHYVGARVTFVGTSWTAIVQFDGVTYSSGTRNAHFTRGTASMPNVTLSCDGGGTVEALQVSTETAPAWNNAFTPGAVLDPSLNALQIVPAVSGDPWQVIQQVADAELAVAGFDEAGVFRFRNRVTIRTEPVARTITAETSLVDLAVDDTAAAVVNRAQVPYTGWTFGSPATVWQAVAPQRVARNSTRVMSVTTDGLVATIDPDFDLLPGSGTVAGQSYYRASTDPSGMAPHPGITITARQRSASQIDLTLTNRSAIDAWLVSPATYLDLPVGTPTIYIGGRPVTPSNTLTADVQWSPTMDGLASSSLWGEIVFSAPDNSWVQDEATADELARDIVADMCVPRPNLTDVSIVPDPRLQLVDRVRVVDGYVTNVDEYAVLFGWTLDYAAAEGGTASWSMTVDARTVTAPGGWILGTTGRTELGTSTFIYA